jgi:hypothetical protein
VVVFVNKRVYNGTFGKIVRTLGFLLVLGSSVFLATALILENDSLPFIDNLTPFADMLNNMLAGMPFVSEYAGIALIAGLIMLLWAIRRGLILRIVLTAVLVFVFIESAISGTSPIVPIALPSPDWLTSVLSSVSGLVNQLTAISPYIVPGAGIAAPFLLWMLFATKKPGRLSIFMLRIGSTTLFLAALMAAIANVFVTSLLTVDIYSTITIAFYIVTYLFFILGGAFGVLGFTRK